VKTGLQGQPWGFGVSPEGKLILGKLALIGPQLQTLEKNVSCLKTPSLVDVPEINRSCFAILSEIVAIFEAVELLCNERKELEPRRRWELKKKIEAFYSLAKEFTPQIMSPSPPSVPLWLGKIEKMKELFGEVSGIASVFRDVPGVSGGVPAVTQEGSAVPQESVGGAGQEKPKDEEDGKGGEEGTEVKGSEEPEKSEEIILSEKIEAKEEVKNVESSEAVPSAEDPSAVIVPTISAEAKGPDIPAKNGNGVDIGEKVISPGGDEVKGVNTEMPDGISEGKEGSLKNAEPPNIQKADAPIRPESPQGIPEPEKPVKLPVSVIQQAMGKYAVSSDLNLPGPPPKKPDQKEQKVEKGDGECEGGQKYGDTGKGEAPAEEAFFQGRTLAPSQGEREADAILNAILDLQLDIDEQMEDLEKKIKEGAIQGRQDIVYLMESLEEQIHQLAEQEINAKKISPEKFRTQSGRLESELLRLKDAWYLALEDAAALEEEEGSQKASIQQEEALGGSPKFMNDPSSGKPFSEEFRAGKSPEEKLQAEDLSAEKSFSQKLSANDLSDKDPKAEDSGKSWPLGEKKVSSANGKNGMPLWEAVFHFLKFSSGFVLLASACVFGGLFLVRQLQLTPESVKKPLSAARQYEDVISPAFRRFINNNPKSLERQALDLFVINLKKSSRPESRREIVSILKGWNWKGVPDVLLETAVYDQDAQVSKAAFEAFKSITGYIGSRGAPFTDAEKWWEENRSEISKNLEDAE